MFGVFFALMSGAMVALALRLGGAAFVLLWPALSFLVVAAAYLQLGACVFAKTPRGTLEWQAYGYLLPFLLYTWAVWHVALLVRTLGQYVCLPVLDGAVPKIQEFEELVARVAESDVPVYVHCAEGHGRSGTLVAAVLIARGLAGSAEEAVARLQKARPGARLRRCQLHFLRRYAERNAA